MITSAQQDAQMPQNRIFGAPIAAYDGICLDGVRSCPYRNATFPIGRLSEIARQQQFYALSAENSDIRVGA